MSLCGKAHIAPSVRARALPSLRVILSLIGFTAVLAQIVLMRELIIVFSGNEISLGLMLANWLLWTAIGSSLLGRLAGGGRDPRRVMASLQVLVAIILPLTIVAVRASKRAFQSVPGEILGPGPMVLTSFATLSFFCALSGCLFVAGSRLYADEAGTSTSAATGSVYLFEAVGSGVGGILASLALIRYLTPIEIASLVGLLNLLAAASLSLRVAAQRRAVMVSVLGVFTFIVFPFGNRRLESISLAYLWRGYRLIENRNSVYGNLAVVQAGETRSLFQNGLVLFNVPDRAAAEEVVHYALLQHPLPKSLLLIGGGINGSLAQALQHASLERVDYVELDPAVLDLADRHFANEWTPVRRDPRIRIHPIDGRLFLKTTPLRFDVVIVNLPDPETAQLNRFYTEEFFREAARKLERGGLISFRVTGAENYISPELADFLRCLNKTLRSVFSEVSAIPGATVHFFAATQPGTLVTDSSALLARLRARQLRTSYVREYYIPFRMSRDRMLDLQLQIEPQPETPVNRDLAPIAYYFDVVLWGTRFRGVPTQWFEALARVKFGSVAAMLALVLFAFAGLLHGWGRRGGFQARSYRRLLQASAGFSVGAMGLTLIGLEVLLLLGFQAIYGYVYHQLAIVIAAFMVGMALGSWRALKRGSPSGGTIPQREVRTLAWLQLAAALSPLLLYGLFAWFARLETSPALSVAAHIVFPVLALLSGMLGGYQFPLASGIFFAAAEGSQRSPGTLYALDLVGACVGAVALSYLVPVFGFLNTSLLMAVVNLPPAALAAVSASRAGAHGT